MNTQELEHRAEEVLASVPDWLWDGKELPVPVEDVVDTCFGLLVRDMEDMTEAPGAPDAAPGQSISGLLLAGPGEIWVNAAEARQWPGRRRFTIGHELGHWCLHRGPGQQALFCRKSSIDESDAAEADDEAAFSIEEEANIFAAALTMPAKLVRSNYEQLKGEPDCHGRMCERFASSRAAMGKRMHSAI